MFEGQHKGLYALALANTGERFGYYTMLAIFTLYLQAKFGYTESETSDIYGAFLAGVYFLPLIGGILADKFGYGKMVSIGFGVMFLGYALLSIPSDAATGKWMMFGALGLIALGTGLFKGNLQVMVGNLYDDPRYSTKRDTGFSLFYMAINIGAMFAPSAATWMTNKILAGYSLTYNSQIPALAHQYLNGTITAENTALLAKLQAEQGYVGETAAFCNDYIAHLSEAYNYGFAIACASLIASVLIYVCTRSTFKHVEGTPAKKAAATDAQAAPAEELTPAENKQRITALVLVFAVVIFFWMSFHQNGLTMTFFARDYTQNTATGFDRIGFDLVNLVLIVVGVYAAFSAAQSKKNSTRLVSLLLVGAAIGGVCVNYINTPETVSILPQIFQQFNPFFVVALTPVSLAVFAALAKRGKEPTAPRKIAYGMLIAAAGFCILSYGSQGLPTPDALAAEAGFQTLVSPNWLI